MKLRTILAGWAVPSLALAQSQRALTLEATVSRAIDTHPAVSAAMERVQAARGSRLTARSWTNPTLSYQVDHAPLQGRSAQVGLEREATFSITLPLEPTYQLWSRSARASAELRGAEADVVDARRTIAVAAAEAFHRAANAQIAVEVGENVRTWVDSLVDYTRKRVTEGVAAEGDLIRLEVEQAQIETDLVLSRVELARALADVAVVAGVDSVASVVIDTVVHVAALPAVDRLIAMARQNRPDLRAADADVDAAKASVSMERSSIFREIGGTAGIMTMSDGRSLVAGVSMPFPLFDQNRGEIQRASAERRAATYDRALVDRHVVADVTSSYAAVQAMTTQLSRIGGRLLTRAEEGRRIAEGAYREGAVPLVQVLDAARAFADARMLYYRALFALRQNMVELNAAIGSTDVLGLPTTEVR